MLKRSFERVSVDGQLSTNDTVILQCSGASGVVVEPETEDELRFGEALDALMRQLALMVVRDGEGARRVAAWWCAGATGCRRAVARSVANSSLVKTALYGGDPTGGGSSRRSARRCRHGAAGGRHRDRGREGVLRGRLRSHDRDRARRGGRRDEVEYEIGLPGEGAEAELYFSDLGHEYVTINADYTT